MTESKYNAAILETQNALSCLSDNSNVEEIRFVTEAAKQFIAMAFSRGHWDIGTPHQYETLAGFHEKCAEIFEYSTRQWHLREAAKFWEKAAAASLGHNRSARYEAQAKICLEKAENPRKAG